MEELATTFYLIGEARKVAVTGIPTYHYVQRKGSILHSEFTLKEIREYMSLAESYVVCATTDDIRCAAATRIFLLGRRLGCAIPHNQKWQACHIINQYCRKYCKFCLSDEQVSIKEKIRALFMSISSVTLRIFTM